MVEIDAHAISRISKLIPRLGSDHDGEVVATARAIIRSLQSSGADLHDMAGALAKQPAARIIYVDRIVEAPAPRPEPEYDPRFGFKQARSLADRLLSPEPLCALNAAETKFVRHMRDEAHKRKGKFRMTVKQADWFERIVEEYLGGAA